MAEWVTSLYQETLRRVVGIIQTPEKGDLEQARAGGGRCCYLELIFAFFVHESYRSESAQTRSPEMVRAMETLPG